MMSIQCSFPKDAYMVFLVKENKHILKEVMLWLATLGESVIVVVFLLFLVLLQERING